MAPPSVDIPAAKGSQSDFNAFKSLDSQISGSASYLLSSPSEPPDLKNWFSSYEYQSPESSGLPPIDLLGSYILEEGLDEMVGGLGNSGNHEEIMGLGSDSEEGFLLGEIPRTQVPTGFLGLENLPIEKDKLLNGITDAFNGGNLFEGDKCKNPHKKMRSESCSEQIDGNKLRIVGQILPAVKTDLKATLPTTNLKEHEATSITNDLISSENKENSQRSGKIFQSSWISARDSQKPLLEDGRKSWNADSSLKENESYFNVEEKVQLGEARTSADETGLLIEPATMTTTMEVPGKWQCPRKSKPAMRPPLKQLRLERWVHRVI